MTADWLAAWATVVAAIAAIAAVAVASGQLQNLVDSFRMSSLAAVLTMEAEIFSRSEKMDEFGFQMRIGIADGSISPEQIPRYSERLDQLTDNYLNAIDRLAFCILKDYLPEKDWRIEYEPTINDLMSGPTEIEATRTFNNIVKLYTKWQKCSTDEYGEFT